MVEVIFFVKLSFTIIHLNKLEFIQALCTIYHTYLEHVATVQLFPSTAPIGFCFPAFTPHLQIISDCGTIFQVHKTSIKEFQPVI